MKSFLTIVLTLTTISASAGPKVGALIGPRFNNRVTEGQGSFTYKSNIAGYQIGGLFIWDIMEIVGIRTGLIYTTRDAEGEINFPPIITIKETVSYFDVPINAVIGIPATSLYFFGGVKAGIKSSSSCSSSVSTLSPNCALTSTNFIGNLGAGYELFGFGVGALSAELEYEHGLTNINDTPGSAAKIYTNAYAINAVATFGF